MTLKETMELLRLEREIAQLERALTNQFMAAAVRGTPENQMAEERIAKNRMRLAELKQNE